MSGDASNGDDFVARFRAGDEEAARELFHRHVNQLLELARHRISQRLAPRVDAEDVVQSVFRTFFKRVRKGEFTLHDEEDVCKLLVKITVYKTLRQIAFHSQAKRDARQEVVGGDDNQEQMLNLMANGPTSEEAVVFLDQLDHLLNQLSADDRQICRMRIEGYNNTEIADALNINERRIRRLLERLRGQAKREDWMR